MTFRTRFAPSPTGDLHIGGVRTALFSYLFARHHAGEFVLRIEDTDRERSTAAARDLIIEGMQWLGLHADEGPILQSERFDRYRSVVAQMLESGSAYYCYCTREELDERREAQRKAKQNPAYDRRCRDRREPREGVEPVVRFRNPLEGAVVFDDLVQGRIAVSNEEIDDFIIARSDGTPTYNFTVVVDDLDMNISHVIRGDDHINNTPKQINVMRAIGKQPPAYAHVPMILGADGAKLSKRHGAASVLAYRDMGYLPEALLNYLVRLGWSHGDQETFTLEQMIELFDVANVNKSASAFNPDKLVWLNQHYLKTLPAQQVALALAPHYRAMSIDTTDGAALEEVVELYKERAKTLLDIAEASAWLFSDRVDYDPKAAKKHLKPAALPVLKWLHDRLTATDDWREPVLDEVVAQAMQALDVKMGAVAQPLRLALTGGSFSPAIGATLRVAGQALALERIGSAIAWLEAQH